MNPYDSYLWWHLALHSKKYRQLRRPRQQYKWWEPGHLRRDVSATQNPTMEIRKMVFLFNWVIFRFHVNFPGGRVKTWPNPIILQYCWWKKSCTAWSIVYPSPSIDRTKDIPGGAGCLPSIASFNGYFFACKFCKKSKITSALKNIGKH